MSPNMTVHFYRIGKGAELYGFLEEIDEKKLLKSKPLGNLTFDGRILEEEKPAGRVDPSWRRLYPFEEKV